MSGTERDEVRQETLVSLASEIRYFEACSVGEGSALSPNSCAEMANLLRTAAALAEHEGGAAAVARAKVAMYENWLREHHPDCPLLAENIVADIVAEHEGCVSKAEYDWSWPSPTHSDPPCRQHVAVQRMIAAEAEAAALRTEREALREALSEIANTPSPQATLTSIVIARRALARTDTGGQEP